MRHFVQYKSWAPVVVKMDKPGDSVRVLSVSLFIGRHTETKKISGTANG